jgi:FMN phosphatase YigB (HAD superfamily)
MVILFDIDGTLINHDSAEAIAVAALRGRTGHTEDGVCFLQRLRSAFERHYNRYLTGELSIQEQRRARLREVFDPNENVRGRCRSAQRRLEPRTQPAAVQASS